MFKPMKCPEGCSYSMSAGDGVEMCGYILITGKMRGCDPGRGCKRYTRGAKARQTFSLKKRGIQPTWDAETGYKLYLQRLSDREIATALGIEDVAGGAKKIGEYRRRCWMGKT